MCAVSESGRGARIHVSHVAAACLAYFCCGLTGALCTPGASTGQRYGYGGGRGDRRRRENGIILSGGYLGGGRGRAPREKLLFHVTVILIRLPSSIASGFGGLFIFFA